MFHRRSLRTARPQFAAGGGPFTPLSLPGLKGWYKADAGAYHTTGPNVSATNGQTVISWADQSGTGAPPFSVLGGSSGGFPTLVTGGLNGLPVLSSTGSINSQTAATFPIGGSTVSFFAVVKTTLITGGSDLRLFTYDSGSGDTAANSIIFFYHPGTSLALAKTHQNGDKSSAAIVPGRWNQLGTIVDGPNNNDTVYLGGVPQTPVADNPTFAATGTLTIGDPNGLSPEMQIAEIIICNTALGSTDRTNLTNYLFGRWGVPAISFSGVGNIPSLPTALAWWGLRAYNTAYASGSQPCLDLTNSGGSTVTINILSTGFIDTVTAAPLVASGYRVSKVYDQIGTNHLLQASHSVMPRLDVSSIPYLDWPNGADADFHSASALTQSQPLVISTVVRRTGNFLAQQTIFSNASATGFYFDAAADRIVMYAGSANAGAAAADASDHAVNGLFSGTSSILYIDGTSTAVSTIGTNGTSGNVVIANVAGAPVMRWREAGVWAGDQSSFFSAINASQHHAINGWDFK